MTSLASPPPLSIASPYQRWHDHFLENRSCAAALPWQDSYHLSASRIARLVARSIQQFQLGELARGRGFVRRAAHASGPRERIRPFVPTLRLFIEEEQEHSGILGRFLDREQIPRLTNHWLDEIFRRLRKLAGLEACATVLVTAEVLAMPFYQALRDSTGSPLLRAICVRILCDEAAHLNYQALTSGPGSPASLSTALARSALVLSLDALPRNRADAMAAASQSISRPRAGDFHRFWNDAQKTFSFLQSRIQRGASLDDLRWISSHWLGGFTQRATGVGSEISDLRLAQSLQI